MYLGTGAHLLQPGLSLCQVPGLGEAEEQEPGPVFLRPTRLGKSFLPKTREEGRKGVVMVAVALCKT